MKENAMISLRNLMHTLVVIGVLLMPTAGAVASSEPFAAKEGSSQQLEQEQVDVASAGRLKLIELNLLRGWTAKALKRGEVRPHGLAAGPGVHIRADADPKSYPLTRQCYWGGYTIHLWLMAPDYAPGRFAKEDLAATATYLGRTDQFRALYFVEKGTRTPGGSVGGHLAQGLDLNLENNHRDLARALAQGSLEEKMAALDELFLFLAYNFEGDAYISNAMREWGRPTFQQAVQDPAPKLRRHIEGLFDEAAFLAALPREIISWKNRREVASDYLFETIRNRPDLTESLYGYFRARLTEPSNTLNDKARVLRLMAPPPENTLRAALTLRQTEEMEWFTFRAFLEAAIHHASRSDDWGLTYELTPFSSFIMPETRNEAREFFQRAAPHEAAAVGLFRALKDEWREGMGFGNLSGLFGITSLRYDMEQRSAAEWIKEGWPGKGKLGFFSSFAQSAELKRMILKQVRERENTGLDFVRQSGPAIDDSRLNASNYWFLSQQHMVDLLALNFLIREPLPEALPDLLPLLGVQQHSMANGMDPLRLNADALYREIILNPSNETKVYATQAMLKLGRSIAPKVLDYLTQRIAEEAKKQVDQGPVRRTLGMVQPALTDIDLGCLILGILADPEVRADFDMLGKELSKLAADQGPYSPGEVSFKVWQVAGEWFDAGGRQLLFSSAMPETIQLRPPQ